MNAIPHHIPPHLAHCVRTHRIATSKEERRVRTGDRKTVSPAQRAENARRGKSATPEIERLIRVCWAMPFTITTLIEKAELMGLVALSRKVYQSRLAKMANRGLLEIVGKEGREHLYQAKTKAGKP